MVDRNPDRAVQIAERFAAQTSDPRARADALSLAAYASGVQLARTPVDTDRGPTRQRLEERQEQRLEAALREQNVATGPTAADSLPGEPVISVPVRGWETSWRTATMYRGFFATCREMDPERLARWQCLNNFGRFLIDIGDANEAEAQLRDLLELNEDALTRGERTQWLAQALDTLGAAQIRGGRFGSARLSFEKALRIQERFGVSTTDLGVTLASLAATEATAGKFRRAQDLYERAIERFGVAGAAQRANLVTSLDSLARVCWNLGEYQRALPHYERALALAKPESQGDRLMLARNTWGFARVHFSLGNLSRARGLFERSRSLAEAAGKGDARVVLGLVLVDLSKLLGMIGEVDRAKQMSARAVDVLRIALGNAHPDVVAAKANLAGRIELQDPVRAEAAFEGAVAAAEQTYGPDHPVVGSVLVDLAGANRRAGHSISAARHYRRALTILETSLGINHPDTARALGLLSEVVQTPEEGVALGQRAVTAMGEAMGPEHPDLAPLLYSLARNQALDGRYKDGIESALRADEIASRHLQENVRTLPEQQALRFAATRRSARDLLLSLGVEHASAKEISPIWNAILRSRALVLDELTSRRRFAPENVSADARKVAVALSETSRRLSNLLVRGDLDGPTRWRSDGLTQPGYRTAVANARDERDDAERALAESVEPFREDLKRRRLGWLEIAAKLPRGAALVGYVRFNQLIWPDKGAAIADKPLTGIPSYAAFVLRGGEVQASLLPLGDAAIIDAILAEWRRQIGASSSGILNVSQSELDYVSIASRLRRMVWDSIQREVKGSERVFVVPDGALNLLNWAALPDNDGRYLAESGPTFHYLSNERDLVRSNTNRAPGRGLMVVGAPAFDDATGFASLNTPQPVRVASAAPGSQGAGPQNRGADCGVFSGVRFEPLPGSEREAHGVASLWDSSVSGNAEERATLLIGSAAQEATFKASAPSRRVLHLATHGFFYDGSCPPSNATNRGVGGLVKQTSVVNSSGPSGEQPDAISGLALAGANNRNAARESEEDGILTADEISTMDLSRVEWAVLSGCDTGVGEVKASEGVFGIRRAFQAAGVGSLIMSLWPVGDENAERWKCWLSTKRGSNRDCPPPMPCARPVGAFWRADAPLGPRPTPPFGRPL